MDTILEFLFLVPPQYVNMVSSSSPSRSGGFQVRPLDRPANPGPGRQAPYATGTRAPASQVYRHWTPRHDVLGVANQHRARHVQFHRRPSVPAGLSVPRLERAVGQVPRPAHSQDDPALRTAAPSGGRRHSRARTRWAVTCCLRDEVVRLIPKPLFAPIPHGT